jgi:hypothetical protein
LFLSELVGAGQRALCIAEIRNPVAAVQTQPRRLLTSVPTAPQCSSFIRSGSATPVVHLGGNAKAQPSRFWAPRSADCGWCCGPATTLRGQICGEFNQSRRLAIRRAEILEPVWRQRRVDGRAGDHVSVGRTELVKRRSSAPKVPCQSDELEAGQSCRAISYSTRSKVRIVIIR